MIQPYLLYVLVRSDDNLYLKQAFISMYSDAHITLLTNKATESTLTNNRKKEVQYTDDIISVDLDTQKYNARQRSRIHKTSARQYVKGDSFTLET